MTDIARTVTVTGFGNMSQLEAALEKAGFVAESTSKTISGAAADAGKAAAKQAQEMGLSADKQVSAAGRAAAASVEASAKITRAQRAAGAAAMKAAEAAGLSTDMQAAASDRAMASQAKLEAQATASSSRMGTVFAKLGHTMGAWGIPFSSSVSKMGADISKAESKTQSLGASMAAVGKVTVFAGAIGAGAAAIEAVKLGEAFQTAGASIKQNTGQSDTEIKKLTNTFAGTAGQFEYSGQQMEAAYGSVAGQLKLTEGHALSAAQALKFESVAADVSAATGGDLASTTGAVAAVMQAFGLSVRGAAGAGDELFNVARGLGVPVDGVATAVDKLHARLGALSPSLKDTGALMLDVGEHGIRGTRGVMVVNTAMQTLVGGSTHTRAALQAMGVNIFDQQGKFIGLGNVIAQLAPKLAGLSQQQQIYVTKALFGASAGQMMNQIIAEGVPGFQKATDAATKLGTAHAAAKVHSESLDGELHRLGAGVETLAGKEGLGLIPDLAKMSKALADGVQWMEKHKTVARDLGYVVAGVLGLAVAVFAERTAVKFGGAVKTMGSDMGKLAGGVKSAVAKIIAQFGAEAGASEAATAKIAADSAATDASFAGTADAATAASAKMGAAEGTMVGEVTAADTAIEGANAAAGASFKALGFGAVKYLGMIGVAVVTAEAALHGLGSALESVTGEKQAKNLGELFGGTNEHTDEGESGIRALNRKNAQALYGSHTSGGIMAFFEAKGLTPAQAAGIVGNMQQESSLNPNAPGGGLIQGQGGRTSHGTTLQQLEGIWRELTGSYSGALGALKKAKTPQEAAWVFSEEFEHPGKPELAKREKYAAEFLRAHPHAQHMVNAHAQVQEAAHHSGLTHAQEVALGVAKESNSEKEKKKVAAALGVPTGVATMLATAQALLGTKYTSGGGHGGWDPIAALKKIGVDCSGFVSQVLHKGGVLSSPLTTEGLPTAKGLTAGAGKYVTVYDRANAGANSHALIEILGKWFESGGNPKFNPKGGVAMLTAAQAGGELASGGSKHTILRT
jgi:TP901 family phage tail tape measure protein